MNSKSNPNSKVTFITGACGGVGWSTACYLSRKGGRVFLTDYDEPSQMQASVIAASGGAMVFHKCNVTDEDDVEGAFAKACDIFGEVDGLVTSAGIEPRALVQDMDVEVFRRALDVNITGSFLPARAMARRASQDPRKYPEGYSIVFISSVNGVIATPKQSAYGASKGAIAQLTRVTAMELVEYGVRVNAVAPGTLRTGLLDQLVADKPNALDGILTRTPMKRVGEPEEAASVIAFLLGKKASYMTGQVIYVDGGRTAQNLPA